MRLDEIETVMKKYGIASTYEVNYIPYRRFKSRSNSSAKVEDYHTDATLPKWLQKEQIW